MTRPAFQWTVPLTALAVLGSMQAWKATLPDHAAGNAFRAHVKARMKDFPTRVGEWDGADTPLPQEAIALLHPNIFVSRQYVNARTGDQVGLLFIEVEDSRDMMGHYPPNCYPGNGWELLNKTAAKNARDKGAQWIAGDLRIPGTEYEFKRERDGHEERLWVRNFFILPDNTMYPEIGAFGRAAADFQIRPYGAAQVQVIYDRDYPLEDRERIFESLITAHRQLIDAVRTKD